MRSVSAVESRSTSYPQSTWPVALSYVTVNHTHHITQLKGSENLPSVTILRSSLCRFASVHASLRWVEEKNTLLSSLISVRL